MNRMNQLVTNQEISFQSNEIIVSKTDKSGKLVYANNVFCRVAEMSTKEVIGKPHNIIRHPDMPRVIFNLLWETISAGNEIFAYVKNLSKTGKYYWVIAHVTPSFDCNGQIDGYHSTRRAPKKEAIDKIVPLYKALREAEFKHDNKRDGLNASLELLKQTLSKANMTYSEFVWSLGN